MRLLQSNVLLLLAGLIGIVGAAIAEESRATGDARWYLAADVERGGEVYAAHCAVCHGVRAQGAVVGSLTAPPLNGGGHSAHHGLDYLVEQVTNGGAPKGGKMPAFAAVLAESDRRAAIAWIQHLWPDATYRDWQQMHSFGPH
ncbi:MAG: cytochrome c [Gammaproteobacteria bacterium]